jgi:predicted DNA-binding transcriptional regulator YafY
MSGANAHWWKMQQSIRQNFILDILRAHRHPTTARFLAQQTDVSERTIYRDIASMIANNVPISGEAGAGYLLEDGYDLPPLMFTRDELDALLLGADMVVKQSDSQLAIAAHRAISKIAFILPNALKDAAENPILRAIPSLTSYDVSIDLAPIRKAMRDERKLDVSYCDVSQKTSSRVVWPIVLGYFEGKQMLVAWCETRQAFRHFRTDRILNVEPLLDRLPTKRTALEKRWLIEMRETLAQKSKTRSHEND